jgi:protein KRI1
MARKKSATKKAREAAEAAAAEVEKTNVDVVPQEKPVTKKAPEPEESLDEESSSSEEEDEYGDLITEKVEQGIEEVLNTIKTNPKKLLDPKVKFFDDYVAENETSESSDKPIYLKDYHRMNLLSGDYKQDEESQYGTVDGEKPFSLIQKEEKDQLLSEIKNAFENDVDSDNEDDDFLTKKTKETESQPQQALLPNPEKSSEEFLKAFLDTQSWIPKKGDKVINLDKIDRDDDEDFENAVENFEHAYNFRYEDANAAEIVSYARNQATLRRSKTNSRKRQRDKKNEAKTIEKKETEEMLKKKKTAKVNQVMDRLTKIKEAVGDEVNDEVIAKVFGESLLDDDFDDADWDNKMAQVFDEQYYGAEIEKPEWDEDDEIMADFKKGGESEDEGDDFEEEQNEHMDETEIIEQDTTKKSKKDKLKDKKIG